MALTLVMSAHNFASRLVPRECLPLPVPDAAASERWGGLPLSRSVVRRLQRSQHREAWLSLGVQAINDMFAGPGSFSVDCLKASTSQHECLRRLRVAYGSVPPPERLQSAREAYNELQGCLPGYSSSEVGALAAFREGHVALPPVGSAPVPLLTELGRKDLLFLDNPSRVLLNDLGVQEKLSQSGLKEPYIDPVLKHSRKKYSSFVCELFRRGVVKFGRECKAKVGAFFVLKKNSDLRLIFDTRMSNCHFQKPPNTDLMGPQSLADLYCQQDDFYLGQGDIRNAFYLCGVPDWLQSYFCLPAISVRHLDAATRAALGCSENDLLFPQVAVLPMGWTWATYFCQKAVDNILISKAHHPAHRQIIGRRPPAPLSKESPSFIVYIDNFAHLGLDEQAVKQATLASEVQLRAEGFEVHEVSYTGKGETCQFLGVNIGSDGIIRNTGRRIWRIRLCLEFLLETNRCTGKELERIIGHLTFMFLLR